MALSSLVRFGSRSCFHKAACGSSKVLLRTSNAGRSNSFTMMIASVFISPEAGIASRRPEARRSVIPFSSGPAALEIFSWNSARKPSVIDSGALFLEAILNNSPIGDTFGHAAKAELYDIGCNHIKSRYHAPY